MKTTYITYNISGTINEKGLRSFSTTIKYDGIDRPMLLNFKDNNDKQISQVKDLYVLTGNFNEEVQPIRISLSNVYFDKLPNAENWAKFLLDFFISQKARIRLVYDEDIYIRIDENEIYVLCVISKDKRKIKKFEFGRYLPLENSEHVRKSTSWTKGVFVNDNNLNIEFMQDSWFGEEGEKYCLDYNEENKKIILNFLQIPFNTGWIEEDITVGENNFYKSKATLNYNGIKKEWTFPLLDFSEQDLPLPGDALFRNIFRLYYDSFLCNSKRQTKQTIVLPINQEKKTTASSSFV